MIKTYSLGAVQEVTGSKHVIEFNGKKILVDCGAFQGKDSDEKNKQAIDIIPSDVDTAYLTHAHFDHCGHLPLLVKKNKDIKIFTTPATGDLTNIVLLDAAKIQSAEAAANKTEPLYNDSDVAKTMDHILPNIDYGREYDGDKDYKFKFYDAGHILGSAMIQFDIQHKNFFFFKKNTVVLYTGDLGRKNTPITRDPDTSMNAPDYIFMESTYGDRLHSEPYTIFNSLKEPINRTIERGGKVIIPSFAVERTQELIYYLRKLMNDKEIPNVPIYIDSPMAIQATSAFQFHTECYNDKFKRSITKKNKNPFAAASIKYIKDGAESLKIAKDKKPAIIISASGMCQNGRILTHLRYGLNNPLNTVVMVGYSSEGSLGRKLIDGKHFVNIENKNVEVKAEIVKIDAFSSHADYKEMYSWLLSVDTSKLKKIFLVHGDEASQNHLIHYLNSKGFKHVESIKPNKKYILR